MLAIIDKPLIEYAVEEAISAGAEEIIFITSHTKPAIKKHFSEAPELGKKLFDSGKIDLLKKIKPEIFTNIKFTYIDQAEQKGLGHAILLAEKAVGNDVFSVYYLMTSSYQHQHVSNKFLIPIQRIFSQSLQ